MSGVLLKLTTAGRLAVVDLLTHCKPGSIAALAWDEADSEWQVGAFNKEKIPASEIVSVSGISFVFQPKDSQRLAGKTLDYRDGAFFVE